MIAILVAVTLAVGGPATGAASAERRSGEPAAMQAGVTAASHYQRSARTLQQLRKLLAEHQAASL